MSGSLAMILQLEASSERIWSKAIEEPKDVVGNILVDILRYLHNQGEIALAKQCLALHSR
jgi:hypothetical protein